MKNKKNSKPFGVNFSESEYFEWLAEKVHAKEHDSMQLVKTLFETAFIVIVPNDENRSDDGLDLREDWLDVCGLSVDPLMGKSANLLEVLIALSIHFDDLMPAPVTHTEAKHRPSKWFWEMLKNADVHEFTDDYWNVKYANELRYMLDAIMKRLYDYNGIGGFFPLRNPKKDQRDVELWYQMNDYIMEKNVTF